jgi:hypothetical protein
MIGLVDSSYGLKPGYGTGNTMQETSITVTKAIIEHDRNLDALADAQGINRAGRSGSHGLPFWVPNYSKPLGRRNLCDWRYVRTTPEYDVCTWRRQRGAEQFDEISFKEIVTFLRDSGGRPNLLLRCTATFIGRIKDDTLGDVPDDNDGGVETPSLTNSWVGCMSNSNLGDIYPLTGQRIGVAFVQTSAFGAFPDEMSGVLQCGDDDGSKSAWLRCSMDALTGGWRFFVVPRRFSVIDTPSWMLYPQLLDTVISLSSFLARAYRLFLEE